MASPSSTNPFAGMQYLVKFPRTMSASPCALVMIAGCSGGLDGPSSIYHQLTLPDLVTIQFSPSEPTHAQASVMQLQWLLNQLDPECTWKIILIGWSAGASIITQYACHYSEKQEYLTSFRHRMKKTIEVKRPKIIGLFYLAGQLHDNPIEKLVTQWPKVKVYIYWGKMDTVLDYDTLCPEYVRLLGSITPQIRTYPNDDHDFQNNKNLLLNHLQTAICQTISSSSILQHSNKS